MSSIAEFIRSNPERARGLEQMTTYVPYLFADTMSLVQSQAALTVSRLASTTVAVCLHEHPSLQQHVAALQRELSAVSSGALSTTGAASGGEGESTTVVATTTTTTAGSSAAAEGGDLVQTPRGDSAAAPPLPSIPAGATATSSSSSGGGTALLFSKYRDPKSRALIAHYKRNVAAELAMVFMREVEVLVELTARSNALQRVVASRGLGACLDAPLPSVLSLVGCGGSKGSSSSPLGGVVSCSAASAKAKTIGTSSLSASPSITSRVTRLLSGSSPLPTAKALHHRSRRAGWIVCWTITLIKSILRLYLQRSTMGAAARSLLVHLQRALASLGGSMRKRITGGGGGGGINTIQQQQQVLGMSQQREASPSPFPEGATAGAGVADSSPSPMRVGGTSIGGDNVDSLVATLSSSIGPNRRALAGVGAGRAPSSGLVIPRVATTRGTEGGRSVTAASPPSAHAVAAAAANTTSNGTSNGTMDDSTTTTADVAADVYLFSGREYLAALIDAWHALKPLVWTAVACTSRNPSSYGHHHNLNAITAGGGAASSIIAGRGGGATTNGSAASASASAADAPLLNPYALEAFSAMSHTVPRLYQPSWRGWCAVTALELAAFTASVWLKLSRHPVVVVTEGAGGNNGAATGAAAAADPSTAVLAAAAANATTTSSVAGGIDNLPMTVAKDHQRVMTSVHHLATALLQDPYFAVVLRDGVIAYAVEGGVARIPIVGGIIGAQVMMYMLRRNASFLASNFN